MKNIEWIKSTPIAHRGLHSEDKSVPENSLAAFRAAVNHGYPIELDINILKDDTVIVFHDKDLKRMTGNPSMLKDVDYVDIQGLSLLKTEEKIPTLDEVLALVGGKVPLLIELKHHFNAIKMAEILVGKMKHYPGLWAVQSFHPNIVLWFKKHHPEIPRGQISEYFLEEKDMKKITKYLLKTLKLNILTKPDFINYGLRDMPNRYLDRAKRKGYIVIGYAAKSQAELDQVKARYHNAVFEFFIPKEQVTLK